MIKIANYNKRTDCMINSKGNKAFVDTIHMLVGDNKYAALYEGRWYSAIYNTFTGSFDVDNIYGLFNEEDSRQFDVVSEI